VDDGLTERECVKTSQNWSR